MSPQVKFGHETINAKQESIKFKFSPSMTSIYSLESVDEIGAEMLRDICHYQSNRQNISISTVVSKLYSKYVLFIQK